MAPLLKELSSLEVESLNIVEHAPGREGFCTTPQERGLNSIIGTLGDLEVETLLTGQGAFPVNSIDQSKCCCCCPCCCACC